MRLLTTTLVLTAAVSAMLPAAVKAQKASFDCRKASTQVEKVICKDKTLSALDARVAQAYATRLRQLPPNAGKVLKATQQRFLAVRDQRFDYAKQMPEQAVSPRDTLQERLDQLNQIATTPARSYAGTWSDNAGSWWIRRRKDGHYDVAGSSAEPVSARGVCNVGGIAKETRDGLVLRSSEDADADTYVIKRSGNVLGVEFRNGGDAGEESCGVAASLQGEFLFTTENPAKQLDAARD